MGPTSIFNWSRPRTYFGFDAAGNAGDAGDAGDADDIETGFCTICQENAAQVSLLKLECSHGYHLECITKWVADHRNCPVCREKLGLISLLRLKGGLIACEAMKIACEAMKIACEARKEAMKNAPIYASYVAISVLGAALGSLILSNTNPEKELQSNTALMVHKALIGSLVSGTLFTPMLMNAIEELRPPATNPADEDAKTCLSFMLLLTFLGLEVLNCWGTLYLTEEKSLADAEGLSASAAGAVGAISILGISLGILLGTLGLKNCLTQIGSTISSRARSLELQNGVELTPLDESPV